MNDRSGTTVVSTQSHPKPTVTPVRNSLLQRKCACGGTPGPSGECAECRKKRLQRKATNQAKPSAVPHIVHEVLRTPGQPLDQGTRAFIEPRFGHDFSRVHADARAAQSAKDINALAYTVGDHIAFGARQYASRTEVGKRLLTYDELGNLITEGPAAGTPDVWSPVTHFSEHQDIDVKPFNVLGWQTYNQYRIPNKGDNCSSNRGEKRKAECEPEYLGMGAYLGADCIISQGPDPKI